MFFRSARQKDTATPAGSPREDVWIPTVCWGCVEGPCNIKVHRVDGVAVNVKGNADGPGLERLTKNRGRVCPKPFGLIQKLYDPHRLRTPLKRTNPKKGVGVDPGWTEISWNEALDIIAEKLREARALGARRVCVTGGPGQHGLIGTSGAFWPSYGPVQRLTGGGGIRCDMGEHNIGNILHGGFQCEPDLSHCQYLIIFGSNSSSSGGVPENIQFAEARARGMKIVLVDPVFPIIGGKVDEWVPIKPGTDLAFILAMIDVILNELGIYDERFLKDVTNSPYLVGDDGYFVRDPATNKVQVWDPADGKAKSHDDESIKDLSLEGSFSVHGVSCKPSFQVLKEHVAQYTPEWAAKVADVSADTIRRIAREYIDNALIGSTITIDGLNLPYRPVATKLGRGITGSMRSYQFVLANHILACLAGCLEVVGGHQGGRAEYTPFYRRGFGLADNGIAPGADGMTKVETFPWTWPPISYDLAETLIPYGKIHGHPSHLAYKNLSEPPTDFPLPPAPLVFFSHLVNPLKSIGDNEMVARALLEIPFVVVLAHIEDEMTQIADVVLPDRTDLEKLEPLNWLRSALARKFYHGLFIRQPVVEPLYGIPEISDVFTELAERVGILDSYNQMVSDFFGLVEPYKLEPGKKYSIEDITNRSFLSATHGEYGLDWFRENGARFEPTSTAEQYDVHLKMKALNMRYLLPYFEHVKRTGEDLGRHLTEAGIDWWPTVEYVPLPTYFPSVLEELPPDYDFYVTTCRVITYSYGSNTDIPWVRELDRQFRGVRGILMNAGEAKRRGIAEGDEVWIESQTGKTRGKVRLYQGVRPDTVVIAGQFGRATRSKAGGTDAVSQNPLTPIKTEWTDHVVGSMQSIVVKGKVYKA